MRQIIAAGAASNLLKDTLALRMTTKPRTDKGQGQARHYDCKQSQPLNELDTNQNNYYIEPAL